MNAGVVPISDAQLALSAVLLLLTGLVSAALGLGLLRPLLVGGIRAAVQLLAVGAVLHVVFGWVSWWAVALVVTGMTGVATLSVRSRQPSVRRFPQTLSFLAMWLSTVVVAIIVLAVVVRAEPWYTPRVAIPICGMLLGNSMNAIALSLESLYRMARDRRDSIETLLALGATPWEAIRPCVREAVRLGMMPSINALVVVGLVSLPGMMTGQILGGANPRDAVRYQIVVMYMITAATGLGCLLLAWMGYRRLFTADGALDSELRG